MIDVTPVVAMIGEAAAPMAGKRLIWTGTNGFLGRWVLRVVARLNRDVLSRPCELTAVDLTVPDDEERHEIDGGAHIRYVAHDLTTRLSPPSGVFDYVVHMAGIASPHHYRLRPLQTADVAIEGSRGMLDIARQSGARYLFCSSSEVYQTATVTPTPESYVGAIPSDSDRSCYDVSKLMGETLAHIYHTQFGTHAITIRIFNSFGPGLPEADHRILPRVASSIVRGSTLKVYGNASLPSRTYCPSANTVAGVFLALLRGGSGETYNIGLDRPELTVPELIARIAHATGHAVPWELVPAPDVYTSEPLRRCPDISKARRELGYDPQVGLDEGLRAFFAWAIPEYRRRVAR